MPKFCFVAASLLVFSLSLTAQEKVPGKSGCVPYPGVPDTEAWIKTTLVSSNRPYHAPASREKGLREAYGHVEVGMSLSAVEKIMGNPDFQHVMVGSSGGRPTGTCIAQWAYVFRKDDTNPISLEDAIIYLSFSANGQLYWAAPQNLELKPKGGPVQK